MQIIPLLIAAALAGKEPKPVPSGIIVMSLAMKDPATAEFKPLMTDDSIFYDKGFGLEEIYSTSTDDTGLPDPSSSVLHSYNLIDYTKNLFVEVDTQLVVQADGWKDLKEKKNGLSAQSSPVEGIKFLDRDTVINNERVRIMVYKDEQGIEVTAYFAPTENTPMMFSGIEMQYKGRIRLVHMKYTDGNEIRISVQFIPKPADFQKFKLMEELKKKAG